MISGIYGVVHRPTERWYVGRAQNIVSRWALHRRMAANGSSIKFHERLKALPATDFTWIVLQPCSPIEAVELEAEWIKKLIAFENGFNSTEGGELTPGNYASIRKKMSVAWEKRKDRSFLEKLRKSKRPNFARHTKARELEKTTVSLERNIQQKPD